MHPIPGQKPTFRPRRRARGRGCRRRLAAALPGADAAGSIGQRRRRRSSSRRWVIQRAVSGDSAAMAEPWINSSTPVGCRGPARRWVRRAAAAGAAGQGTGDRQPLLLAAAEGMDGPRLHACESHLRQGPAPPARPAPRRLSPSGRPSCRSLPQLGSSSWWSGFWKTSAGSVRAADLPGSGAAAGRRSAAAACSCRCRCCPPASRAPVRGSPAGSPEAPHGPLPHSAEAERPSTVRWRLGAHAAAVRGTWGFTPRS